MGIPTPPSNLWGPLGGISSLPSADAAVVIDNTWALTDQDRAYIDSQNLAMQQQLLMCLLLGMHCTWFILDAGSAAASKGDVVCSAGTSGLTVTRALPTPLAAAGIATGIVVLNAPIGGGAVQPGAPVLVAMEGLVPASITGIAAGSALYAIVSNSARVQATGTVSSTAYPLGVVDAAGNLTLGISGPSASVLNVSNLFVSIVDIVNGQGAGGLVNSAGSQTQAVGFGPTQAGHSCTGGRFIWAGPATTIKVSLWDATATRVANVSVAVSGAGTYIATFASAVALVAGESYAIAMWDTAGAHFTTYNGAATGTGHLGDFMPIGSIAVLSGPYIEYVPSSVFAGTGSAATIYGMQSAGDTIPNGTGSGTVWSPIEPMAA